MNIIEYKTPAMMEWTAGVYIDFVRCSKNKLKKQIYTEKKYETDKILSCYRHTLFK